MLGRAAAVATAAALAAGCGGGGEPCAEGTAAETGPAGAEPAYLTGVEVERDGCLRVVLSFEDGVPGYRVAYEPAETALVEDGSGRRVALEGEAFLVVRLEPAMTARISDEGAVTRTYDGPRRLEGDPPLAKTGDFEAVVRWTVGLDERLPFDVEAGGGRLTVRIG